MSISNHKSHKLDTVNRRPNAATKPILCILLLSVVFFVACTISFHISAKYQLETDRVYLSQQTHQHPAREESLYDSSKTSSHAAREVSCLQQNSPSWINGNRIGNLRDPLIKDDFAMKMILDDPPVLSIDGSMSTLLQQSLCHKDSRFLNWTDDGSGEKSLHFWGLRLIYLAFHVHQHRPARAEATRRRLSQGTCKEELKVHSVGNFDYECREAKFLVVPMAQTGLGAAVRLGAVNALIAGVATNRSVLFVNNAPSGPRFLKKPWNHASCDRRDFQCFYLPISPCVTTEQELTDAYVLQRGEQRRVFKFGDLPEEANDRRVILADFANRPQRVPETFRPNMLKVISGIIDKLREASKDDSRISMLQQAAQLVLETDQEDPLRPYYYSGGVSKVHHAAVFYTMRPNPHAAEKLEEVMSNLFPDDFNPELAFGLPIRASDKCLVESECLSFDLYMKLLGQTWMKNDALIKSSTEMSGRKPLGNIVLTSESQSMLSARLAYETNTTLKDSVPFPFRFITNKGDIMQGTGLPSEYNTQANVTADDIMLSTVSSLKTQLMAKFTVSNCCSNFHLLINDFLRDGCGAASDNIGQCLQENEDPKFRVCCQWSKTEECLEKKQSAAQ